MTLGRPPSWRVIDAGQLRFRFWDDECVVYHVPSGDTHLLDRASGEALKLLEEHPSGTAELARRVAQRLELPDDELLAARIGRVLEELGRLDLIEPVTP